MLFYLMLETGLALIAPVVATWVEVSPLISPLTFVCLLLTKYWPLVIFWPVMRLAQFLANGWDLKPILREFKRHPTGEKTSKRSFLWVFLTCNLALLLLPFLRAHAILLAQGSTSSTYLEHWIIVRNDFWPFYVVWAGTLLTLFLLDQILQLIRNTSG